MFVGRRECGPPHVEVCLGRYGRMRLAARRLDPFKFRGEPPPSVYPTGRETGCTGRLVFYLIGITCWQGALRLAAGPVRTDYHAVEIRPGDRMVPAWRNGLGRLRLHSHVGAGKYRRSEPEQHNASVRCGEAGRQCRTGSAEV